MHLPFEFLFFLKGCRGDGWKTYGRSRRGKEEQAAQVSGALVAQGARGVDEGADAVRLQRRADQGRSDGDGGPGGLLRAQELLLSVSDLSALVGLAEEGA